MAATVLNIRELSDAVRGDLNGGDLQLADATDGATYVNTGVECLVVYNSENATNTLTFHDADGTAQDALTLPANDVCIFGPLASKDWGDTVLVKTGDATNVKFAVIKITGTRNLITRN